MTLSALVAMLAGLWQLTGHALAAPSGLAAPAMTLLAGAVLAVVLAACLASAARLGRLAAAVPQVSRASALREKSWRAGYLQQRDPDAAGRPRPRAPSAAPAAAIGVPGPS